MALQPIGKYIAIKNIDEEIKTQSGLMFCQERIPISYDIRKDWLLLQGQTLLQFIKMTWFTMTKVIAILCLSKMSRLLLFGSLMS